MPSIPPDQCSPYGTAATAQHSKEVAKTANPHQRQGDRGCGDDDAAAAKRLKAEQLKAEQIAARRTGLLKSGLPVFYRFDDLVAAGIAHNRTTLRRLVDKEGFPPGMMVGANTRIWRVDDIESWLATRSTARKATPPTARHPRTKRRAAAQLQP